MSARRKAAIIAEAVFDHIADERQCIKQNIEEVVYNGLLLGHAREAEDARQGRSRYDGSLGDKAVTSAAITLIQLLIDEPKLVTPVPTKVREAIDSIYNALLAAGWRGRR